MTRAQRTIVLAVQATLGLLLLYGAMALPDLAARWGLSFGSVVAVVGWIALAALGFTLLRDMPRRRSFAVLTALLMLVRVAFALLAVGRTSTGDPNAYLNLAKGLLGGHGLVIFDPFFGSAWRALFPPLYPLLLAGWGAAFGFATPAVLALGTLTDGMAAWLIERLGARLGSARAGRRAAWLYLIWPSVLFSAPLAQKESLCAVLVLALALSWIDRRSGWRGALALGVPAGLLSLTQPGEAPLAALFGLVLVGRIGLWPMLLTGLRGAAVAVVVMLPWWVRNWLLFHTFVPLTTASGASLWIGNNPDATGNWEPPPPELKGIPEMLYGKRIQAIAVEWIRTHPRRVRAAYRDEIRARLRHRRIRRDPTGGDGPALPARAVGRTVAACAIEPPSPDRWCGSAGDAHPLHARPADRRLRVATLAVRHLVRIRRAASRVRHAVAPPRLVLDVPVGRTRG